MPYGKSSDKSLRKRAAIKKLRGSLRQSVKDPKKKAKFLSNDKMKKFKFGR
tara:strand:- start:393 stop:545 length:153 start_codon:yes stop_codon:yes gene_type:complete